MLPRPLFTLSSFLLILDNVKSQSASHLKLDFDIKRGDDVEDLYGANQKPLFIKRDGSSTLELSNQQTFYMANISVGSNKDNVACLLDTGSSDLWVMASNVECEIEETYSKREIEQQEVAKRAGDNTAYYTVTFDFYGTNSMYNSYFSDAPTGTIPGSYETGTSSSDNCLSYGSFDYTKSTSFKRNESTAAFNISYLDDSGATGFWGTDTISFGDTSLKDMSFAVANVSSSAQSVLGIGLPGLEMTATLGDGEYENLPLKLKSEGLINRAAYSLYLGESYSATGSVLFGAIDTEKFSGQLSTVPIINSENPYYAPYRMEVLLSNLKFNNGKKEVGISTSEYPAILDSGTTFTRFPAALFETLGSMLGGKYDREYELYSIPCVQDPDVYLSFNFSGAVIKVPLSQVMVGSKDTCYLTIMGYDYPYMLIGDNVLRSAYAVYDFESMEISLAQARFSKDENVVEMDSSGVPSAVSITSSLTNSNAYTSFSMQLKGGSATTTVTYPTAAYLSTAIQSESPAIEATGNGSSNSSSKSTSTSKSSHSTSSSEKKKSGSLSSYDFSIYNRLAFATLLLLSSMFLA